MIKVSQPLPLSGSYNTRDLGGYPKADGTRTRSGVYLRSDTLTNLTEEDCKALEAYGVGCVLDLRSPRELEAHPSRMAGRPGVDYYNIVLRDRVGKDDGGLRSFPPSMGELYMLLLEESGHRFKDALELILSHPDQCVLFNCTSGKDRTGTFAMLLLKLAGVDEETIVADYAVSEKNLEAGGPMDASIPDYVQRSVPESMEYVLAHLRNTYGTVEAYLAHIGLTPEQIEALRARL